MVSSPVIALIGAGNMGGALLEGLIRHGYSAENLFASDPSEKKLSHYRDKFGIQTTIDNKKAISSANIVIFAIKPQLFAQISKELQMSLHQLQPLIISIAAGIRIQDIKRWLNISQEMTIVRAMPNMPAVIGEGATALYSETEQSSPLCQLAENLLSTVGIVRWVAEEALLDTITALSGSGPAYFYLMMEALEKAAVELGLPSQLAHTFTLQTVLGAAKMGMKMNIPFTKLREQVTSKGGTTEKGLAVLEENDIQNLLKKALEAAKLRAEELAKQLGEIV